MYYVGSVNFPEKIYFSWEEAVNGNHIFIDVFDSEGNLMDSFRKIDGEYKNVNEQ